MSETNNGVLDPDTATPTDQAVSPGDRNSTTDVPDDSMIVDGDTGSQSTTNESQLSQLPPALQRYLPMLSGAAPENLAAADNSDDAAPAVVDANVQKLDVTRGVLPASRQPAAADAEVQMRLLMALDNKQGSLADITLLMTSLTAVPIRLNVVSFRRRRGGCHASRFHANFIYR